MKIHQKIFGAALLSGCLCAAALPAHALSMSECSAKYKAAKAAGTLGDEKWNDFRKAQCGADATPAAAPAASPAAPAPKAEAPKAEAPKAEAPKAEAPKAAPKTAAAPAAAPAAAGDAVFPSAIDPKYASEKPGAARRHTCDDQYKTNKANNGNGGLKWTQKGGGYYSECNKRLKG